MRRDQSILSLLTSSQITTYSCRLYIQKTVSFPKKFTFSDKLPLEIHDFCAMLGGIRNRSDFIRYRMLFPVLKRLAD